MGANPNLKHTTYAVFEVNYRDFERLVKEVYGQNYEFIVDCECGNDTQHVYLCVGGKGDDLDEYDYKRLDEFARTGKYCWLAQTILADLCQRGIIDPGNYIIRVSW